VKKTSVRSLSEGGIIFDTVGLLERAGQTDGCHNNTVLCTHTHADVLYKLKDFIGFATRCSIVFRLYKIGLCIKRKTSAML